MPRLPDSAFETETEAIKRLGGDFDLLDLESLLEGDAQRAMRRVSEGIGPLLYRGWMIPPARYDQLATAAGSRGTSMITSPLAYASTHYLPRAYPAIEGHTPRTVWMDGGPPFDFEVIHAALRTFGHLPVVIKDFVKSRKHEWDEACFIPAADDRSAVERVVGRFLELQGDDLAGGLVFREFVELDPVGRHSQSGLKLGREYRLFLLDAQLLVSGRYWDGIGYADEHPVKPFERLARDIPSRFFSMDVAKTTAGDWIVMEIGDGQVSGLPDAIDPDVFYSRLAERLR